MMVAIQATSGLANSRPDMIIYKNQNQIKEAWPLVRYSSYRPATSIRLSERA